MKIVPGLPDYLADSDGTVWRLKKGVLTPCKARRLKNGYLAPGPGRRAEQVGGPCKARRLKNGYLAINVRPARGVWRTEYQHRLVARAWLGDPPEGAQTRHLDGDKSNNSPVNLAWGDPASNTQDRLRHGRTFKGKMNPAAKLDNRVAYAMREAVKMGVSRRAVARHFGTSRSTVGDVVAGKRWVDGGTAPAAHTETDPPVNPAPLAA